MEIKHLLLGLTATLSISPAWGSGRSYVYQGEELGDKFNVLRPIYQQSDANVDDVTTPDGIRQLYMRNRRVLTGDGCHVNTMINVVDVANAAVDVANLTDDDISNVAEFAQGVGVEIGVGPIVSVRDVNNYYAAGTQAGFCIVASNGSSVLSLDVIKTFAIGFWRDGELVGTLPVSQGNSTSGVDLSLVQIAGSNNASMVISAEAPGVFDEISINSAGGLNLSAIGGLRVKYGFVGEPERFIMNRDYTVNEGTLLDPDPKTYKGGITLFNEAFDRNISLDYAKCNLLDDSALGVNKFVENPEDSYTLSAVLGIGGCSAEFHMKDNEMPENEVFEAGTEVGFKIGHGSLLKLGIGSGTNITLYDRKGKETETVLVNAGVLDLGAVEVDTKQLYSTVATKPFSGAKLSIYKGVEVELGATSAYYAYIQKAPDQTHSCPLNMSSDVYLAPTATSHQLSWNQELAERIEFTLDSKPEGSEATVSQNGLLSPIDKKGQYVVTAYVVGEGHENCRRTVTVRNDQFQHVGGTVAGGCATPLTNMVAGPTIWEPSSEVYETSGSLLSISDFSSADNITDADYDNYAEYVGGLGAANDLRITGVKRVDGKPISDGSKSMRIGFVVEETINGLNAKVLEFLQIRCYDKAQKGDDAVFSHVIDESNVISADVIGTGKVTKVRYTVEVPAGKPFDEFQLWKSGVLDLSLSDLKIYYPFMEEANSTCSSLLGCDGDLLWRNTSIAPVQGGGVSVGQYISNLSNFVDNDIDSYMTVGNTVQVGQAVLVSVGLGQTIDTSRQLGIIVDNKTYLAGVNAGSWLKIILRRNSTDTGDEFSNWSVADANVAGYGDKNVLYMTPTQPFDELYMEIGGIAGVTDGQHYYGIMTRGDSDNDGIPDCMDQVFTLDTPVTGIENIRMQEPPVVCVNGNVVNVCCKAGISAIVVYDMSGHIDRVIEPERAENAYFNLENGIYTLLIEPADGPATALKLTI